MAATAAILLLAGAPLAAGTTTLRSVEQYGITWTFDRPTACGRFVNGDWYVIGKTTVIAISPKPHPGRNGSVLNLTTENSKTGFDDRLPARRYDANYDVYPPLRLEPGDALVSSISVDKLGSVPSMLRAAERNPFPVRTAAVLTCLVAPAPADAFRPSYCDRTHLRLYRAGELHRDLLPRLPLKGIRMEWEHGPLSAAMMARMFERPWINTITYEFANPLENMPAYGREIARAAGIGSLLLASDLGAAEKEPLLIDMVQVGIDLWGIVEAGGYAGWFAHGGHGSGRKWLISFAGLMLGDARMAAPTKSHPGFRFQEDDQTLYGTAWTGAKVVWGGHSVASAAHPDWGRYEHLDPSLWPGNTGENYRRCCTSHAWVGEALAARLLGAMDNWAHPAFFDYVDRWMTEDDTAAVETIRRHRGVDYSQPYSRQRQTWDPFVQDMWNTYRRASAANRSYSSSSH